MPDSGLWVVGLGASAGGVEALRQLLPVLPDGPVAYVVAQHMSPVHPSLLLQVLSRETSLKVVEVFDGIALEPGHVYVAPPNCDVSLSGGVLRIRTAAPRISPQPSIDVLFDSLAAGLPGRVIGVVLSGTGSDGASGMAAISAAGGRTIVQDPTTALYRDMPLASIDAGAVEFVVAPVEMGELISDLLRGVTRPRTRTRWGDNTTLAALARETRRVTDWDIVNYKDGTLTRQLDRRINALGLASLADYVSYVVDRPEELAALRDSMLITVTSFMRDRRSFDALRHALKPVIDAKAPGEPVRAWVAACATGEEAYSVAMVIAELVRERGDDLPIKVFATDISDTAMESARRGVYPLDALRDVPPTWRSRYFEVSGEYATVTKKLRESLVIARQDVTRDPPLVRMDLVSCRNLLIYLVPGVQSRVLSSFWAALSPGGLLFLGRSESVPGDSDMFDALSTADKIYRRGAPVASPRVVLAETVTPARALRSTTTPAAHSVRDLLRDDVRDRLLTSYGPPSLLVDPSGAPVHQVGDASRFLRMPTADGNYTVVDMVVPGLRTELATMLNRIGRDGAAEISHIVVLHHDDGTFEPLRLEVSRIRHPGVPDAYALVSFVPTATGSVVDREAVDDRDEVGHDALLEEVADLEAALSGTREHLQAVVEELEASNEELQAMNEELQASSEELQATNEELETTNEELQATNEELTTVNETLEVRTTELTETNAMLQNIQDAVHTAIVLLDREGRVQRYSPLAVKVFGLTAGDLGRRLVDLPSHVDAGELGTTIDHVLSSGEGHLSEVSAGSSDYLMQVMPYVVSGRVDGVVVALANITELVQKRLEMSGRVAEFQVLSEAVPHMVYRTAGDPPTLTYVSPGVQAIFGVDVAEALERPALLGELVVEADRQAVERSRVGPDGSRTVDFRVQRPDGVMRYLRDMSETWTDARGRRQRVGTVTDVTDLRLAVVSAERERIRAQSMFSLGGVPMASMTAAGVLSTVNEELCALVGRRREDLVGTLMWDVAQGGGRTVLRDAVEKLPTDGSGRVSVAVPLIDTAGDVHDTEIHLSLITLPATGDSLAEVEPFVFVVVQDNTEIVRARRAAEVRGKQVESVFGGTAAPMAIEDATGRILQVNGAMCTMLDRSEEDLVGRPFAELTYPEDVSADLALFGELVRGDRAAYTLEKRFLRSDGGIVWGRLMVTTAPDLDSLDGRLFITTVLDITGEREREAAALRVAQSDVLTGLANRVVIFDRLRQALLRAKRTGEHVSVIFIDLDGFKGVNDRLGHDAGDDVLRAAALRLRGATRESDSLARLGGDEFLVVASHDLGSPLEGARLADQLLRALAHPFGAADGIDVARLTGRALDGQGAADVTLTVTPSIGVTQFPTDGDDVEELVRKADVAMYAAKGRGGNQVHFYSDRLQERSRMRAALRLELSAAIQDGQIVPFLQPVLDASTRRVVALEVLARWQHPQRGLLGPFDFLPDAEEFELLDALTLRLVEAVGRRRTEIDSVVGRLGVAFNLAPQQLGHPELLAALITTAGVGGCTVEVTEAAAFGGDAGTIDALRRLRAGGARTSLDDFGTGYSSVLHLKAFGFDEVKIDREFVSGSAEGPDATLVTAMVGMAHALGAIAVAEGVETAEQADVLTGLGVDRLQGFHFARPMAVDDLLGWLEGHR
ncbi:MAG: EAL domain-containing protein [Candidatus Nanopelagicales bacterium]